MRSRLATLFVAVLFSSALLGDELAQQSANPVANMISVPFEYSWHGDVGPSEKAVNALMIKPVYPLSVGRFNLINRLIVPVVHVEGQDRIVVEPPEIGGIQIFPGTDDESGLGNVQYQGWFSPAQPGKVIWGVGPVLEFPTHTNDALGSDTWSGGPSVIVLTMTGNWVMGAWVQNMWDFAGDGDEPDVNRFSAQYFVNYLMDDGWYLNTAPVITADWEARSGEEWTVPVGGGVGRLVRFGTQPVDFRLAAYWNLEAPRFGPDWTAQFTVKFLFPKR